MARDRYGYGSWEAPYWFLGLEEGMDKDESEDRRERIKAWHILGKSQLDDCRLFHNCLYHQLQRPNSLHGDHAVQQKTWRRLILVLESFPFGPEKGELLEYQRNVWAAKASNTCVIELSGLAARNANDRAVPHDLFQQERIEFIRSRIQISRPNFIVMYGKRSHKAFREIIHGAKSIIPWNGFVEYMQFELTAIALTVHPTSWRPTDNDWRELGATVRRLSAEIQVTI